jgi:hypothetical protein
MDSNQYFCPISHFQIIVGPYKSKPSFLSMTDVALYDSWINDLIDEAKSDTGTWSLATYTRLQSRIRKFSRVDCGVLVRQIMALLTDPSTTSTTRYKLSQICSVIHKFAIPEFQQLFALHGPTITHVCDNIVNPTHLGRPTTRLLLGICGKGAEQPKCSSADGRRWSESLLFRRTDVRQPRHESKSVEPGDGSSGSAVII